MNARTLLAQLLLGAALFFGSTTVVFSAPPSPSPKSGHNTHSPGKPAKPLSSKHKAWGEAITKLEQAKKILQADNARDTSNHKSRALEHIQKAMQELRQGTQGSNH